MRIHVSAVTRFIVSLVDWRRAVLLLPLLAAVAAAVYYFGLRDTTGSTPRAVLLETAAPAGVDVGPRRGQVARDFSGLSPDGEPTELVALRGKPVIVNFWATWCASCAAELPDLRDLQNEVGADKLSIVAVNTGESSSNAGDFMDFVDAPDINVVMDPTLVVADAYGVRGMPHSVFLDANGFVRAVYIGQLTVEIAREYLEAAQAGSDATDIKGPLRFSTTVAREPVLEVHATGDDEVELRSKSLRCDDAYCATALVDALEAEPGVVSIERYLARDPAAIVVRYDASLTNEEQLTELLAAEIRAQPDPLYTLPLVIED
jgi:thiol-disulfide isomerase/thioredoxin